MNLKHIQDPCARHANHARPSGGRRRWTAAVMVEWQDDEREGVCALGPVNVPWVLISAVGERSNGLRVPGVDGKWVGERDTVHPCPCRRGAGRPAPPAGQLRGISQLGSQARRGDRSGLLRVPPGSDRIGSSGSGSARRRRRHPRCWIGSSRSGSGELDFTPGARQWRLGP